MYRIGLCLVVLSTFNCRLLAQGPATVDPFAPGENIYKHFTGTIGNHKAVLDLRYGFQEAANFGGSTCYFTDEGGLSFFRISKPPSFSHTEVLRAQVFPENLPLSDIKEAYSIFVQTSRFDFTLSHDSLIGKWFIQNATEPLKITLTEDNTLPFAFKHAADSAQATGKKNEPIKAVATYSGVQPSPKMKEKDAKFITNAVSQFMGVSKSGVNDLPQAFFQQFLTGFNTAVKKGEELDGSNFSGIYTFFPVYTDNGFLVFQLGGYQYDFAKKEYTDRNRYLSLDLKNKKTLKLDDILDPTNDALTRLLEQAFRKKYQLDPGKKLSDLFTADNMPLTDNFILANKGIIFSYYPAKIFRDSEDISELQEMRIFLSWEELGSLIRPDFNIRLGLK